MKRTFCRSEDNGKCGEKIEDRDPGGEISRGKIMSTRLRVANGQEERHLSQKQETNEQSRRR